MSRIVSSVPGRIRIRDRKLRDRTKLNNLMAALSEMTAIIRLQDNVRTGSMLVRFDPRTIDTKTMEADIDAAVERVLGGVSKQSLILNKEVNRYNKLAMLASLGASMAITVGHKKRWRRWHALTGYVFLANLGLHLFIYRKSVGRLFR